MRIARGRAVLEADSARVRNLSLTAALRLIQEKSGTPRGGARRRSVGKKTNTANSLDALGWWGGASPKQRRHFLEGVGLRSLRDAEPPAWSTRVSEDLDHLALPQLVDLLAHRLQLAGIDDACMDLRRIRERIERARPSLDLEATPVAGSA